MTNSIGRFLRFVAYVDGRTRTQLAITLGCSIPTIKRLADEAREYGMDIQVKHESREAGRYTVKDWGPFDKHKLQQLPWRTMGRKG